jgi:hypothetical protein
MVLMLGATPAIRHCCPALSPAKRTQFIRISQQRQLG